LTEKVRIQRLKSKIRLTKGQNLAERKLRKFDHKGDIRLRPY